MMKPVILYKTKKAIVYRKGVFSDEFLLGYSYSKKAAEKEAARLNEKRPKSWQGSPLDIDNIDYFFASEQEEMF